MKFIKSPSFWLLLVAIFSTPHISEQVALPLTVGCLSTALITALLQGATKQ